MTRRPPPSAPLLVLIGPSAAGKTSLAAALERDRSIRIHPSWTTRPRRPDEVGVVAGHRFIDDETFDHLATAGRFLDVVQPFGLEARYGLPTIRRSGEVVVDAVLLRAPFVERLRAHVHDLFVVQIEASADAIASRLKVRGLCPEELAARRDHDAVELAAGRAVADAIVDNTGSLDAAAATVRSLLAHCDARCAA